MSNILEVENLQKVYTDSNFGLKDISFQVPYGSIVGFIGENGAGKTTTMGTMLGLLKKDSGSIKIFGKEINVSDQETKEDIGVVFDRMLFSGDLDVIKLSKVLNNTYKQWDNKTYFHYINQFSLPKKKKVKEFSRGMSMKLSLAVALSHHAKLLILDEATAGLDPVGREALLEVLLGFVKDKQQSILLSSHITELTNEKAYSFRGGMIVRSAYATPLRGGVSRHLSVSRSFCCLIAHAGIANI